MILIGGIHGTEGNFQVMYIFKWKSLNHLDFFLKTSVQIWIQKSRREQQQKA